MTTHKNLGFTLVELLVVIVVIGILATIAVVSYNGVLDRARTAKMLASFDTYEKVIRSYGLQYGSFPVAQGNPTSTGLRCLNDVLPATAEFNENVCGVNYIAPEIPKDTSIMNAFRSITSSLPDTSDTTVSIDTIKFRGLLYSSTGDSALLMYFMNGDRTCGRGSKQLIDLPNNQKTTQCALVLYAS